MAITKKQSAELARQVFEYAPAPEAIDHVKIQPHYGLFIGGRMVEGHSKKRFPTINPATESKLAEVVEADEVDVDRAVKAADKAFDAWARLSPSRRARYLYRVSRLLQERSRELAVVETMDGGKPIKESRDVDIPLSAAHFFYYAGWADKLEWAFPNRKPRPLGVAGQVIPWNFPLLMLAWKIAPALAAGNTVVLKPAETTPLTALLFAEICQQAELPAGVVNIVTGAGETGRLLVEHSDVDKVAFTGSTEVGRAIARSVAGTHKRLTLELGGKAANIVFDDAPIDQAVEGIVNGIFFNQGHVCCAGSRLLVQESVYSDVLASLRRRLATLRLGDPLDKNTDVGAINSAAQLAKIRELSEIGEAEGAQAGGTGWGRTSRADTAVPTRIAVRKTDKLYIGGAFPRSESGRSYVVTDQKDRFLANAALASRKDARDAVTAARKAFGGWSAATAYNRGQVLYRVAELLEGRRAQFVAEVRGAEGLTGRQAEAVVDAAIDRWVWYAGWADKLAQVRGSANPVAGPYFNFSLPEPTGVVAVIAPQASSLLGFVSVVAPAVVSGNTVVAVASERFPLPAVSLSEVLATSDVPGGVINVLTGRTAEIAPWLASHMDVNAIDLSGATGPLADDLAVAAAENLKRVVKSGDEDWTLAPGLDRMLTYLETKTVWHPAAT